MGKRIFTDADREAARNLRKLWEARRELLGLTQEKAGGEMGMNQSAVSQYLKGIVPLRLAAALKFAKLLKVKPTEIRQDLADLTSEVSPDALEWAQRFDRLDSSGKAKFWDALLIAQKGIPDEKLEHLRAPSKRSKTTKEKA